MVQPRTSNAWMIPDGLAFFHVHDVVAPKTVENIRRMLDRAFKDAVAWNYLTFSPAEHASLPREARSGRNRPKLWTLADPELSPSRCPGSLKVSAKIWLCWARVGSHSGSEF
jgi:hypothetical protein